MSSSLISSSSSSLCRRKRSRVTHAKKTSFRLNEEKNFSLIKLHFYSSFLLTRGSLCSTSSRNIIEEREKYAEDESAKKADWGARRVEFDRE